MDVLCHSTVKLHLQNAEHCIAGLLAESSVHTTDATFSFHCEIFEWHRASDS